MAVREVDVLFAEDSPLEVYALASEDAVDWFELEPELEIGPTDVNYLWFIFPAAPQAAAPAVREIEVRGFSGR